MDFFACQSFQVNLFYAEKGLLQNLIFCSSPLFFYRLPSAVADGGRSGFSHCVANFPHLMFFSWTRRADPRTGRNSLTEEPAENRRFHFFRCFAWSCKDGGSHDHYGGDHHNFGNFFHFSTLSFGEVYFFKLPDWLLSNPITIRIS